MCWWFVGLIFLFCGWSEGYPLPISSATVCFVLFVSLCLFQDLYCWVNFFRGDMVPASALLWAGCWVSSPPVIIVWSVFALVSGWWVFLIAVPVELSRGVVASVSVPFFLMVMVAALAASVVLVVWIGSWAGLGSFLVIWVVGSFRCFIFWCWMSLGAGS